MDFPFFFFNTLYFVLLILFIQDDIKNMYFYFIKVLLYCIIYWMNSIENIKKINKD